MAKYLVTGGAGFIGSHIVDALVKKGDTVVIVDDLSTGSEANINKNAEFYPIDIANNKSLEKLFKEHRFLNVFHMAAKINTSIKTEEPLIDLKTTVQGTINLANLCVAYGCERLVFGSSVAVYGSVNKIPVNEDREPEPIYSYSIAKLAAELYLQYYIKNYNLPCHILRYSNVYGPRQPIYGEVGVIAIFIERLKNEKELIVFGDGEHIRDYIYVDDIVEATIRSSLVSGNLCINVGSGKSTTVNQLVDTLKNRVQKKIRIVNKPERSGELGKFYCDINNMKEALDWFPKITIAEGLEKLLVYYKL